MSSFTQILYLLIGHFITKEQWVILILIIILIIFLNHYLKLSEDARKQLKDFAYLPSHYREKIRDYKFALSWNIEKMIKQFLTKRNLMKWYKEQRHFTKDKNPLSQSEQIFLAKHLSGFDEKKFIDWYLSKKK